MMVGFGLWVYETLVVRFCACAVALNSAWVRETGRSPNRGFKFQKRSQLIIRMHDEALTVVAMRVCNPDRLPVGIHG